MTDKPEEYATRAAVAPAAEGTHASEPAFLSDTRAFYDTIAADYDAHFGDTLATRPVDRSVLAAFAELVRSAGGGPVLDAGCGPGRVTAHLAGLGLEVSGLDLSPGMVRLARAAHPGVRYETGALGRLPVADGALAGLVAWYSLIHTPWERLPEVFAEFRRALAPGGLLLAAFQVGAEPLRLERPFGHEVSLDFRRLDPEEVAGLLRRAGFSERSRLVRAALESLGEGVPQAFLILRADEEPAPAPAQLPALPPQLRQTVLDGPDARALAEFYRRLLGLRYRPGDEPPAAGAPDPLGADWLVLQDASGIPRLAFQQVDRWKPPTWPGGPRPAQLHLDLTVGTAAELQAQHERVTALGARLLADRSTDPEEPLRVYADPAGHPFCVFVRPTTGR
ncbi:VOC family protein [Streptomyces sp. NPDC058045]|uniref:VOC family protein n=1 Tax=Streptomyces sp. NPDC058045 TaxID=3346311 RepID=UPI0036EAB177